MERGNGEIGVLSWDGGTLKASTPNLPTLSWARPADLAEARLASDPPLADLPLADGAAALSAAFRTIPFVREPVPAPRYGEAITAAGRAAFDLFLGRNAAECADAFRVLRGEVDDFLVCARRYRDVWKAAAFTVAATTLTFRFEDLWTQLPARGRYAEYLVEVVRDPHEKDSGADRAAGVVRETLVDVAPDARICVDLAANGGATLTFWPVAKRVTE